LSVEALNIMSRLFYLFRFLVVFILPLPLYYFNQNLSKLNIILKTIAFFVEYIDYSVKKD